MSVNVSFTPVSQTKKNRIAAVLEVEVDAVPGVLQAFGLFVEAPMGEEDEAERRAGRALPCEHLRKDLAEDRRHVFCGRLELAPGRERAHPEIDDVTPEEGAVVGGQLACVAPTSRALGGAAGGDGGFREAHGALGQLGLVSDRCAATAVDVEQPQDPLGDGALARSSVVERPRPAGARRRLARVRLGHRGDHVGLRDRGARTRLRAQLMVEAERLGRKAVDLLHVRDDVDGHVTLCAGPRVAVCVEVADHLDHERTAIGVAVEARGAGRRIVEVPAGPDAARGVDRDVLGDVTKAARLGVEAKHSLDRLRWRLRGEVRVVGPERVVQVHLGDPPRPGEPRCQIGELLEREIEKRLRHDNLAYSGRKSVSFGDTTAAVTSADRFDA
ncbi:MAG: hypothetical protein U0Q12_12845 [Vicinamibacterales bacterium]